MAITDCQILHANDYGGMNQQLTSSMSDGWKPMGYLRITNGNPQDFYQMMYKGNDTDVDSYQSIIANGASLTVRNSVGTISATGTVSVSQNVITAVTLPATTSLISNTQALSISVTTGLLIAIGTAARTVTPTVSGGVLTGISIS